MIELLAIFAVLAAVWGVLGSHSGSDEDTTSVVLPQVIERGTAARRLLG